MGNIDNVLKKKMKSLGIERQVEAVGVVEKATEEIAKYIPKEDFEVVSFKKGAIKVAISSSSAASELQLRTEQILRPLKKDYSIHRIIFSDITSSTNIE